VEAAKQLSRPKVSPFAHNRWLTKELAETTKIIITALDPPHIANTTDGVLKHQQRLQTNYPGKERPTDTPPVA
jgi:hypothetical protein